MERDNLRGLPGIKIIDRILNTCAELRKGWKKLTKVFSDSLAILKERKMIGLLKGCMWESVWVVT